MTDEERAREEWIDSVIEALYVCEGNVDATYAALRDLYTDAVVAERERCARACAAAIRALGEGK